ncbi:MAG: hypothetical protein IH804_07365 [Planctomycetes bacterium]|nr:hypothetical protein [Planctomycetota bacterium]
MKDTAEHRRLAAHRARTANWRLWGPYLSERAWGTVREDYSADGTAWDYLPHDHARSRAYRWNEDGIAGLCDRNQYLCLRLALWNGCDPILKERMFGLNGDEGNHAEDVKEYYYYLDGVPTHAYMKMLYKYPQRPFPYADLVETNRRRSFDEPEYDLIDTGAFDDDRYFEPGDRPTTVEIDGTRIGLLICEDLWQAGDVQAERRYAVSPVEDLARLGCDLLVALNATPFVSGKWQRHLAQIREAVRAHRLPIVVVNQVGGNDDLVFDGRSVVVGVDGALRAVLPGWEPAVETIDLSEAPPTEALARLERSLREIRIDNVPSAGALKVAMPRLSTGVLGAWPTPTNRNAPTGSRKPLPDRDPCIWGRPTPPSEKSTTSGGAASGVSSRTANAPASRSAASRSACSSVGSMASIASSSRRLLDSKPLSTRGVAPNATTISSAGSLRRPRRRTVSRAASRAASRRL